MTDEKLIPDFPKNLSPERRRALREWRGISKEKRPNPAEVFGKDYPKEVPIHPKVTKKA